MTTRFSGQIDRWTTRPSWRRVWLRSKLGVENLRRRMWEFQELLSACGGACGCRWRSGSWVLVAICRKAGLSSWFIRWRLVVHRVDRERHRLLRLEDLDTTVSHDGYEMLWSLDPADKHVWLLMAVYTWESSLFARDVCLMPRTKFGSDTMLNIIIISNVMCYTMLCMLEWM